MNQRIFSGLIILGGIALLAAVLLISIPASYPSIQASTEATQLMTEHMKMHNTIDQGMYQQQKMITRIIKILEKIMKLEERK